MSRGNFYFSIISFLFTGVFSAAGQINNISNKSTVNWTAAFAEHKVFIENRGQFDGKDEIPNSKILYGVMDHGTRIYFTKKGLSYRYDVTEPVGNEKRKDIKKINTKKEFIHIEWIGSNPNTVIETVEKTPDYFCFGTDKNYSIDKISAYKKIIYHDLYPGIDVVYEFHKVRGIKYSLIVHPGADINQVQMKYSGENNIQIDPENNIRIETSIGNFIDHAPVTFYQENSTSVPSSYNLTKHTVSFNVDSYDKTKTIIIDPWTVDPNFPNDDKAYDVERDAAGNIYAFGGRGPYELQKYTSAGALVWTYVSTFNGWYGDLAVNNVGTSFITEGYNASNTFPNVSRVNTAGTLVYTTPASSSLFLWCASLNCDFSSLAVAGGAFNCHISNTNLATGVTGGTVSYPTFSEVKAISMGPNGNYYCITDSQGLYANQNQLIALSPAFAMLYNVPNNYHLPFNGNIYNTGYITNEAGLNAISTSGNYIYTSDGLTLMKRTIATGALVSSVAIPGGAKEQCSGVRVDSCENVYVGSLKQVVEYDKNMNQVSITATTGDVYGLCFGPSGDVVACGNGFITSLGLTACTPLLVPKIVSNDTTICLGGSAQLLASGGTSYSWTPTTGLSNPNIPNPVATPAATTPYIVTINYFCGTIKDTVKVTVNPCVALNAVAKGDSLCPGSCGNISVTPSGGTSPYTYSWSTGQTGVSTINVCPPANTNYTVTVTDNVGSTSTKSVPTIIRSVPDPVATSSPAACGNNNGSASVTVTSGTGSYTYSWSPGGSATSSITGIGAGNYTVVVTDSKFCSSSTTVIVGTIGGATINTGPITNTSCNGSKDGSASVSGTGGTTPYSYSWSNAATGATQTNLGAGTYTVTLTDAKNCQSITTLTITQPALISVSVTTQNAACGTNTGSATASATGGNGSFTYSWSNAVTGATNNNLLPNPYTVTVTDSKGCSGTITATVGNTGAPSLSIGTLTNVSCNGLSDGSVSLSATGGTTPYTYSWNTAATGAIQTNLAAGTYSITITDVNNCQSDTILTITQPTPITTSATSQNATCGANTGSALASASGSNGGFVFTWSNTATGATNNNLVPATYTLTVTDSKGCTQSTTVIVGNNSSITASAGPDQSICPGQTAQLNASGGTAYNWSPAASLSNAAISNPIASPTSLITDYIVTVISGTCTATDTMVVTVNSSPTADAGPDTTITAGQSTTLNASGGTTYFWQSATGLNRATLSNPTASPTITTTYTVLVTDANGCTASDSVTVTVIEPICSNDIFVPTAFSPNGDGQNDVFYAHANCLKEFHIVLYSRWGERIFETFDITQGWNGIFRGELMNTSVFIYYLDAVLYNNARVKRTGNVTLIR